MDTPLFNIRLDPKIREQLEAAAREDGRNLSDLVRECINAWLAARKLARAGEVDPAGN